MSVYDLYSDAKFQTALSAIGAGGMGQQEVDLLKQIFVAAGNSSGGGGGGTTTWGSITGTLSNQTDLNTALGARLLKAGDTMTGLLQFSGTGHAGLRLNNLTTVQRNAIGSPAAGMIVWDTTTTRASIYTGSAWTDGWVRLAGDTMTGALGVTLSSLGTTPTAAVSLVNSTAAAAGAQQVSPALVQEGKGWKTDATAASQTVRFRQYVLPVQGTANPSGTLTWQSEINASGSWTTNATLDSAGVLSATEVRLLAENSGLFLRAAGSLGIRANGTQMIDIRNNAISFGNNSLFWATGGVSAAANLAIGPDAADILAQRRATNAQEYRVYGTFTDSSNHRRLAMGMSTGGVAFLRAEGAGTGASGNVIHISSLPTSNPGPGILWNNAGTPAIGT